MRKMIYFQTLLLKIRELLWTLNNRELYMLEKLLCSNEEPSNSITQSTKSACQDIPDLEEFVHNFYTGYPNCKEFIVDFYTVTRNAGNNMDEIASDAVQSLDKESGKMTDQPVTVKDHEQDKEECKEERSTDTESRHEDLNVSLDECDNNITCNSSEKAQSDEENADEQGPYGREKLSTICLRNDRQFPCNRDSISGCDITCESNNSDRNFGSVVDIGNTATILDVAGNSVSNTIQDTIANARDNEENSIASNMAQMFEDTNNIEIPQTTQYLLNQVSRENTSVVSDSATAHIQNSLPDLDSKKLISEANKTLSNFLLDVAGESQNEISEQTDSGICTVISSENTSLYDKSPEEKKTFANEIQRDEERRRASDEEEDTQENTSYSCSNLNSPTKRSNSATVSEKCVCGTRSNSKSAIAPLDRSIEVPNLHANTDDMSGKNIPRISSNFDGTNEEFIGMAYGNGHLTLCDSNQSTFQINYSENWENLNLNIDASSSRKEFWGDLKCENCPSTSQSIDRIGNTIEKYAQDKRKTRDERQRRRHHQHKLDRNAQRIHHSRHQEVKRQNVQIVRSATSTESSR